MTEHVGLVWLKVSPRQLLPGSHPGPRCTKLMAWMSCLAQAAFSGYNPNKPVVFH